MPLAPIFFILAVLPAMSTQMLLNISSLERLLGKSSKLYEMKPKVRRRGAMVTCSILTSGSSR
jgi:hypothetical protein